MSLQMRELGPKTAKMASKPRRGHFALPRIEQNYHFVQFNINLNLPQFPAFTSSVYKAYSGLC